MKEEYPEMCGLVWKCTHLILLDCTSGFGSHKIQSQTRTIRCWIPQAQASSLYYGRVFPGGTVFCNNAVKFDYILYKFWCLLHVLFRCAPKIALSQNKARYILLAKRFAQWFGVNDPVGDYKRHYTKPTYSDCHTKTNTRPRLKIVYLLNNHQQTIFKHKFTSLLQRHSIVRFLSNGIVCIKDGHWIYLSLLWPSDAIWRHTSGTTSAQVKACCLMAPKPSPETTLEMLI